MKYIFNLLRHYNLNSFYDNILLIEFCGLLLPSTFYVDLVNIIQTPILWSHGLVDKTVLFEAGQAAPPFLQKIGVGCEFKVKF
jgi:predicted esterase